MISRVAGLKDSDMQLSTKTLLLKILLFILDTRLCLFVVMSIFQLENTSSGTDCNTPVYNV